MEMADTSTAGRRLDLLDGEEVVFERDHVVLTSLRLMANWSGGHAKDVVTVKEVDGVRRLDGGQESRMEAGLKALAGAAALAAVQVPLDAFLISRWDAPTGVNILNTLLFVAWAIAAGVAAYLILTSVVRVRPHTSLLFVRFHGKDVLVSFPGRNNADAAALRAEFERRKRSIPL